MTSQKKKKTKREDCIDGALETVDLTGDLFSVSRKSTSSLSSDKTTLEIPSPVSIPLVDASVSHSAGQTMGEGAMGVIEIAGTVIDSGLDMAGSLVTGAGNLAGAAIEGVGDIVGSTLEGVGAALGSILD